MCNMLQKKIIQCFIERWARFYTFWPLVLPQYAPKTRQILVIYRNVSPSHLFYLSCDIFPKNNIYTVFYWEMGTFLPILTPGFAPICPKQSKFWWYIKRYHFHIFPTTHVTYSLKITFIPCFIWRWARFYPFLPPGLPPYSPRKIFKHSAIVPKA